MLFNDEELKIKEKSNANNILEEEIPDSFLNKKRKLDILESSEIPKVKKIRGLFKSSENKSQLKKEEVFIRRKLLSDYIGEKDIFDLSENIEDQSKNSENIFEEINANSDNKNLEEEKNDNFNFNLHEIFGEQNEIMKENKSEKYLRMFSLINSDFDFTKNLQEKLNKLKRGIDYYL